jgi:glycerol-3-phosphate dehydrogenase (NAD(P)+)
MARVVILGAGMMGSALAVPLVDRGHDVRLVGTHLDEDIVRQLKQDGVHPKLKLALPREITPFAVAELEEAATDADAIALGVSSAGTAWATERIAPLVRSGQPVFMITKGLVLADDRLVTLPDAVKRGLPQAVQDSVHPAAIAGPCIAGELARRVPTCVVVAGRDAETNQRVADLCRGPYYHLFPTTDVEGAETSAALKNAYAMGIAFALGMHERAGGAPGSVAMHNLESATMAQAIFEMRAIARHLGGRDDTVSGLAGVGDLDVTTNGGRTGRFGKLLGLGLRRDEAIERMEGATLECLEILSVLRHAATRGALGPRGLARLPLLEHMTAVALDGAAVDLPLARFFSSEEAP